MPDKQLSLIRKYCDTTGRRLRSEDKKLLCMILEEPKKYNGFTSKLYTKSDSGRDYRDTWTSITQWQYRIVIDSVLRIEERYMHSCDGYDQDAHWTWENAFRITDVRKIANILREISSEL